MLGKFQELHPCFVLGEVYMELVWDNFCGSERVGLKGGWE